MQLDLYYAEPDPDRWIPGDRYPRRLIRRLVRGAKQPSGQERVFLNLCKGLDQLGCTFTVNDFRRLSAPDSLACIIGKPFLLQKCAPEKPILYGASIQSHPLQAGVPFLENYNVRRVLVPGEWSRQMFSPYWGNKVHAWPVGIDTDEWAPASNRAYGYDLLLYNKIRWQKAFFDQQLIEPIRIELRKRRISFREIRYGGYVEADFKRLLSSCRAMIFLCEHETQGIAYQQALSAGVPIFAWDRGGHWQDPEFYPEKVQFEPVTAVPYWDERCGLRFADLEGFIENFSQFWTDCRDGRFDPRNYVLETLTLRAGALAYVEHARQAANP